MFTTWSETESNKVHEFPSLRNLELSVARSEVKGAQEMVMNFEFSNKFFITAKLDLNLM